jgi:hypothetical protein
MPELLVVEELQDYLVAQGVGTLPTAKGSESTTVPSIWLNPRDGAAAPRVEGEIMVSLVDTQLGSVAGLEAWLEEAFIDVTVATKHAARAKMVHRQIRNLIHPIEAHGGRTNWMMSDLLVELSTVWRPEQPLTMTDAFYARIASYRFQCRRKALAGTPDLP